MSKNFIKVEIDEQEEVVLNQENYRVFVNFDEKLRQKILETAEVLLRENLFGNTMPLARHEVGRYSENHQFWVGLNTSIEIDSIYENLIYLLLTNYGSYGDTDETTNCWFNPELLFSEPDSEAWRKARANRDAKYAEWEEKLSKKEEEKNDLELKKKRELFEKLKKELGEV